MLFNQAGVFTTERKLTVDGVETMFAVNHLSYFLLTNLLRDVLLERAGKIAFDDLTAERKWSPFKVLAQSKLANLLFTAELSRKLAGTGVTANSFHPGGVKTGFGAGAGGAIGLLMKFTSLFGSTPEKAALSPLHLAIEPSLAQVTGEFFMLTKKTVPSAQARDPELARRLWEVSAQLTGVTSS